VRAAAEQIMAAHKSIDLLINNAGVMGIPEAKTVDGFEMQLGVDHFGLGLERELEHAGAGTASLIAHPGLSNTDLQAVSVQQTGGDTSQRFFLLLARRSGMSAADGALSQLRAATDPAAKGGEFYGPLFVNSGPPVRKPVVRRLGMDKAIAALWEVSERETGIAIDLRTAAAA
jgi:hypothetical protein